MFKKIKTKKDAIFEFYTENFLTAKETGWNLKIGGSECSTCFSDCTVDSSIK